jgi:hypothetical protein
MPRSTLGYAATSTGGITVAIFTVGGSLLTWLERFVADSTVIWVVVSHALLLPAWLTIVGQLHCYGAFLLRAAARGHDEAPPPPIGALNPFGAIAIPLVLAAVTATALCVDSLASTTNARTGIAWTLAPLAIAATPALVASVALSDNAASGLDPRAVAHVIARSGAAYVPLVAAVCFGYAVVFASIWYAQPIMVPIALAASGYAFLVAQTIAGRVLYARRNELEIETDFSPEQDAANVVAENERELDELLTELHRLTAVDRNRQAYARLDEYLARDRYRNDARVHEALRQFQGRDLRLEHAVHYIERLVAARDPNTAWIVCKRCLDEDERFRPLRDATAIALVSQATERDAHYAAPLLDDFARAYPDSPLHANALFRSARLKIDRSVDRVAGLELLERIEREYPRFAGLAAFRDYAQRARADRVVRR